MSTESKKILILSSYDDKYKNAGLGEIAYSKNKEYADKHGYDFRCSHDTFKTHYFFHKFHLIKELLKDYDYIFWIDADAYFVNYDKKIEDFITDPEKLFIVAIDQEYLNTGVFIIKNHEISDRILDTVINVGPTIDHAFPDAFILKNIFDNNPNFVEYIKPQKLLNAYIYELYKNRMKPNPDGEFEKGISFVLHFPGMPLGARLAAYHNYNVKDLK